MQNKTSPQASNLILRRTGFDTQLTQPVMERVIKQTIALVGEIERKTPWRDQLGPDDRLHTAILKTLDGTRRWDPDRVNLGGHLFGVVSSDISSELKHAGRFRHVSVQDEAHDLEALRDEIEDSLARTAPANDELPSSATWSIAIDALRTLAAGERDVLALLVAYDAGAFEKREVMRVSKLKSRAYDRAFDRLVELAQLVDEDTRTVILQAIA
jgi:hypothetical protein